MNKTASAVGITGLGLLILWSGITNAGIFSTLQNLVKGTAPIPGTAQGSFFNTNSAKNIGLASYAGGNSTTPTGNGTATGQAIANAMSAHIGVPYIWGGNKPVPGWDCYGAGTYVLHNDLGYNLPNNNYSGYLEFLSWGGATTIDRAQVGPGDLLIWPTHFGIAISNSEMVGAENPSLGTVRIGIEQGGPTLPEPLICKRVIGNTVIA